jgi:hypothetical protein
MAFNKATLLLLVLACSCLYGCARPKPGHLSIYNDQYVTKFNPPAAASQPGQPTANIVNPFQELVVSLVLDSLDLLPTKISDKYFDVIMKGIEIPVQEDEIEKSVLTSQRKEDIASVAALIVQHVYGKNVRQGTLTPQTIIYSYEDNVVHADLVAAAHKLNSSQNRDIDAYNACLNLLVNSLYSNNPTKHRPKNGLYVRDANDNLYFLKGL